MELPNLDYIEQLSAGDTAFRQKLVDTIKSELPQEIKEYYNNLQNKDYKAAAGNVHKLKHKISVFGMGKSYYIAEEYEKNLLENSEKLKNEFEDVLVAMNDFTTGL
ncbi:Hpt domain-containing protein [Flavobacterium rhizosphaerae]|uniref:Hpt domain-containing protein n=1 Tax=Flavobacterium rhizosphaerae TaxID=3163298 RepID=A0ABW8Z0Y7_9FLAO